MQLGDALLIGTEVCLSLAQILFQLRQIVLLLLTPFARVLNGLLDTGDIRANTVKATLNFVEGLICLDQGFALLLDIGFNRALLRNGGFQRSLFIADGRFNLLRVLVQRLPAQDLQLCADDTFLFFQDLIAFGGLGLALQVVDLFFQFFTQVVEAIQVITGVADAGLGFLAALLVFGNAGGFFQEDAQLFRFGLDNARNRALFDDGVTAWTQPGAQKDIGNIAPATPDAIKIIVGLTVAADRPFDRNFVVVGPLPAQLAIAVIEHQFDRGLPHRLAGIGTVKHHIGHGVAAQLLGRGFTHDPAHGIDDIRLAAAIGANNANKFTGELNGGRVDKGLETRNFELS